MLYFCHFLFKNFFSVAQVRALSEIVNSGIQPLQNLKVLQKYGDGKEEWARFHIERGLIGKLVFFPFFFN